MVSQKMKAKVAYWAKKLECPVDDNANYENTYACSIKIRRSFSLTGDSGATATSFPFLMIEGPGRGKVSLDIGL